MSGAPLAFSAKIHKLGLNPCVDVPEDVVTTLLQLANRESGPVQVKADLEGTIFNANVVRYSGSWRLYLNTVTRKTANKDAGDTVGIRLSYDPAPRMPPMPEAFRQALSDNKELQKIWRLTPSAKRREILQELHDKKTDTELARDIAETIQRLLKRL